MDLLSSPARFDRLLQGVRQHAARAQHSGVFMWLTQSHAHLLQGSAPRLSSLDVRVPSNCWVPGNTDVAVDGRWWLTGGDTDFR